MIFQMFIILLVMRIFPQKITMLIILTDDMIENLDLISKILIYHTFTGINILQISQLCYKYFINFIKRYFALYQFIINTYMQTTKNQILDFSEKLSEMSSYLGGRAEKTILIVGGDDIQVDFQTVNAIANWMQGKQISYVQSASSDDREGFVYVGNQSQIKVVQLEDFKFNMVVKNTKLNGIKGSTYRIVGISGAIWQNSDLKNKKQRIAQIFDLFIGAVIAETSQIKIFTPIISKEGNFRSFLNTLNIKKSKLSFLKLEQKVNNNILIVGVDQKIIFEKKKDDLKQFKDCDYIKISGDPPLKKLEQFFKTGFIKPQNNIYGNLVQQCIQDNPQFGKQLQKSILDTEKIIQKLFIPHGTIIKQIIPQNLQTSTPQKLKSDNAFLIQSQYNFRQIFDKQILSIDIDKFRQVQVPDYINDRVFSQFSFFKQQNWKISQGGTIPQKLILPFYLSEFRKILVYYLGLNINLLPNVIIATNQLQVFFTKLASLDKLLNNKVITDQHIPKRLGKYVGACKDIIVALLTYRQLTKSTLSVPRTMQSLMLRYKCNRRLILKRLLKLSLDRYQSLDYYNTIITIINDNTQNQNQPDNEHIDKELDRNYVKLKLWAQIYKCEVIIKDYMHDQQKLTEAIKGLILGVYQPALKDNFHKDKENPINVHEILRIVSNLLRIIGRPDLAQYIHKKQRQIKKCEQCVMEQSYFYQDNDKKGQFFYKKAPYFIQQGYPDIARNLYQLAFEYYTKAGQKLQAKLQLYKLANKKYQIDHDELLKLETISQKLQKQGLNEADKETILEEYLEKQIDPEFYKQMNNLKAYNLFRDGKVYLSINERDPKASQIMKNLQAQSSRIGSQLVWPND